MAEADLISPYPPEPWKYDAYMPEKALTFDMGVSQN